MRVKLRAVRCADVPDLATWSDKGQPFALFIDLLIGPEDQDGAEAFSCCVCTPKWFEAGMEQMDDLNISAARQTVFMRRYDYSQLVSWLTYAVEGIEHGETWLDVVTGLSWLGEWEYRLYLDDYRQGRISAFSSLVSAQPPLDLSREPN